MTSNRTVLVLAAALFTWSSASVSLSGAEVPTPRWPHFDPERECFAVLLINTRYRVKGHHLVSTGTLDSVHVHGREVFRAAVIAAAHSVTLLHNHPSGDPEPSAADIKVTRELVQAGRLLKIDVLDHVIIGQPRTGRCGKWDISASELSPTPRVSGFFVLRRLETASGRTADVLPWMAF